MRKSKKKEARHQIEKAIRVCEGMGEVRTHLARALRELDREEKKRRTSETETPLQRWTLDVSTGSLMNMGEAQVRKALGRLDGMISDEKNKILDSEPGDLLSD